MKKIIILIIVGLLASPVFAGETKEESKETVSIIIPLKLEGLEWKFRGLDVQDEGKVNIKCIRARVVFVAVILSILSILFP